MRKKHTRQVLISIAVGAAVFAGAFAGGAWWEHENRPAVQPEEVNLGPFWEVWNTVHEKYIDAKDIDDQSLVWGAIQGAVKAVGDPYTEFFPPQETKDFKESISGNFEGVGMEIGTRKGNLVVIAPIKGTPAYRAGVKAGDRIIAIDGEASSDLSPSEAARKIKGPRGTAVELTLLREGTDDPIVTSILRDRIVIPTVETATYGDSVFLIGLRSFNGQSTLLFRDALREFAGSGRGKLIIDLRGNTGGFLDAAVDTASWFLPMGKTVARERFADGTEREHRSRGYNAFADDLPIVILVDNGSASASEIFAGALREHDRATLVGVKTFGKGSVQELIEGPAGTSLKVTIAKWLTPRGVSISDEGLTPDVEVTAEEEDVGMGRDPQLEKALEILL